MSDEDAIACERCRATRFARLDDDRLRCVACGHVRGPLTLGDIRETEDFRALMTHLNAGSLILNILGTPRVVGSFDTLARGIEALSERRARGLLRRVEAALAQLEQLERIVSDRADQDR
jgi:hypothetical protein